MNIAPLEPEIAVASTRLPWEMHPKPADRILVAAVRHLEAMLVTVDKPYSNSQEKGTSRRRMQLPEGLA
ncbi:MAG: hypothetical protein KGL37_09290, partial [Acidobacteriota bacterium]|nr:hypothetical protein [Acidobacteriota bacterium]